MTRMSKLSFLAVLMAVMWCMSTSLAGAATVTKYFSFSGAKELWSWTTTGKTKLGAAVTGSTNPGEMADPAKLTWYNASGVPQYSYRNYRSGEYTQLNQWKTDTTAKLVAFNLTGKAAGYGIVTLWNETLHVTAIGAPTAAPGYDSMTASLIWFGQTAYRAELGADAPTWWCESDANGIVKTNQAFTDAVEYTFDDYYIWSTGQVPLWIGGFVTNSLAGMEAGTAEYGVLEGLMLPYALDDLDGDGYFSYNGGLDSAKGATDCNDSNAAIHPGAAETKSDGIDSNCNGQDDCFIATASFGSPMEGKIDALRTFRDKVLMSNHWGRVLVDLYYGYSPPVAAFLYTHDAAKVTVRTLLLPVVGAAWVINSHKAAMMGLALGLAVMGLILRRRESMKGILGVLIVVTLIGLPVLASAAEAGSNASVGASLAAALQDGKSCGQAVESLLLAGFPVAEVIPAALATCKDCNSTEIITSAIQAGADPFTVAYVAKNAGADLNNVVAGLQGGSASAAATTDDASGFQPPPPPVGVSSVPVVVTGTSTWGHSHYVASPSL